MREFLVAGSLLLGLAVPSIALAQDTCPAARWALVVELMKDAKAFSDGRKYDEAITKLRAAHELCPEPKLKRSMGRVFEEAGRFDEALAAFRECVAEGAVEVARLECEGRADALQERLSFAILVIEAIPPSASVFLDGFDTPHPVGVPIQVRSGRHAIELRANGKMPFRTDVNAPGAKETRVRVVMEAEPVKSDVVERPRPAPTAWVAAPAFDPQTKWNWVGIGSGAVATGLGVAFLVQYGIDRSRVKGRREVDGGFYDAQTVGVRNLWLGCALVVAGTGAVVTSSLIWPEVPAGVAVIPGPGGGSAAITVEW